MAYNNEAKRLFERLNLKLPKLIKDYRGVLYYDDISRMLDPMPDSEDKKQLVRVLNCNDVGSVKEDKHGNSRYIIPMKYFMKGGATNEKFVRSLAEGVFKKYNGWSGEYLVATATSRYELLAKVIMVLGRE